MSVIDTLITDRTQGAYYNASDLNRVGEAADYVRERLEHIGILTESGALRTDWTAEDIPRESEMQALHGAVAEIREKIGDYRPDMELPVSMAKLDYIGANEIERLLLEADTVITNIELSYRFYAGRCIAGVNGLP